MTTREIKLQDSQEALRLLGEKDARLRELERDFGVEVLLRQDASTGELRLSLRGSAARVEKAARRLRGELDALRRRAAPADARGFEPLNLDSPALPEDGLYRTHHGRVVRPRSSNQKKYVDAVAEHDLTFAVGPAGTGKTYLAVACAVDALERDVVKRIVLVRPAVEAGERLGFLPGDMAQKVDPYLRPLYDALYDLMGYDKVAKLFERSAIEIAPLAFMRGR
ncbi:MAG TPA: phosphate starvation-inducible protein PhoH, partial [Elusimicrobia bacterium]|nr:phosphate starvation-inducible protein PhoH [Elusimicrobiota bacterium]